MKTIQRLTDAERQTFPSLICVCCGNGGLHCNEIAVCSSNSEGGDLFTQIGRGYLDTRVMSHNIVKEGTSMYMSFDCAICLRTTTLFVGHDGTMYTLDCTGDSLRRRDSRAGIDDCARARKAE
jgi:hypothetical protein